MSKDFHDLFAVYENTMSAAYSKLPLLLVVGREPNNPHQFRNTIGKYPLESQQYNGKKRTVAFWDQSYGTVGKTAGMSCKSLKDVARRVGASPIVFTDVMPTPAVYSAGSSAPRDAREATDRETICIHHENIFSMTKVMERVTVIILAGHRHGRFRKRERQMLEMATDSFMDFSTRQPSPVVTVETKSMFGNNQQWNLQAIRDNTHAETQIKNVINSFLRFDSSL